MSRPVCISSLLAVLLGCAGDPPPESIAELEADAEPTDSPFAPSGAYDVVVTVLDDDCTPAHAVPPPWQARVLVAAERGKAKVNLPLSALSAIGAAPTLARSDFRLEPGYSVQHRRTPQLGCDAYTVDATMELVSASPTGFVIETTLVYGDAAACGAAGPSGCTSRVAHTYTLARSMCPAECSRGEHMVAPGEDVGVPHWEIDCRCPE